MTCCTKMPPACRITPESCECCTCTSTQNICEPCPSRFNPHQHEGCSCVHPIFICACNSCNSKEGEGPVCHGHHSAQAMKTEKVESLEEKKF